MKKLGIITITLLILLLAGCGKPDYKKIETNFTAKASSYYERNIKDKVLNVDNHKITIEALETSKVDVKELTDAKCDKLSYVLIKIKLDEKGKQKGNFKTENHLICGTYQTPTK